MFTGIVEAAVPIAQARDENGLRRIILDIGALRDWQCVKPGDSVALNGCCLTVTGLQGSMAGFDVVPQTLSRTSLGDIGSSDIVNVERAMIVGARLDGHLVQGHVDQVGQVASMEPAGGEWRVKVDCGARFTGQCIERGSVCVDGISLTIAELHEESFVVAVIPHTREITNISRWQAGTRVNLEADVIGKYVRRQMQAQAAGVSPELLRRAGFTP
ncbi:MAG: riboflavin synthase [Planctomycetes bacterium]|nr:riboflavin synthase [Planctomycetota bacterium]